MKACLRSVFNFYKQTVFSNTGRTQYGHDTESSYDDRYQTTYRSGIRNFCVSDMNTSIYNRALEMLAQYDISEFEDDFIDIDPIEEEEEGPIINTFLHNADFTQTHRHFEF